MLICIARTSYRVVEETIKAAEFPLYRCVTFGTVLARYI